MRYRSAAPARGMRHQRHLPAPDADTRTHTHKHAHTLVENGVAVLPRSDLDLIRLRTPMSKLLSTRALTPARTAARIPSPAHSCARAVKTTHRRTRWHLRALLATDAKHTPTPSPGSRATQNESHRVHATHFSFDNGSSSTTPISRSARRVVALEASSREKDVSTTCTTSRPNSRTAASRHNSVSAGVGWGRSSGLTTAARNAPRCHPRTRRQRLVLHEVPPARRERAVATQHAGALTRLRGDRGGERIQKNTTSNDTHRHRGPHAPETSPLPQRHCPSHYLVRSPQPRARLRAQPAPQRAGFSARGAQAPPAAAALCTPVTPPRASHPTPPPPPAPPPLPMASPSVPFSSTS